MSQLSTLFRIMIDTVLPIFVVVGLSLLLGRWRPLDINTLSRISIYLFSPALILVNISQSHLPGRELGLIVLASIVVCILLALSGSLIARGLRYEPALASTFILTAFVMNSVNFGYPFIEFAFGKTGLESAVAFSMGQVLMAYLVGTYVASRGSGSWKSAVTNVITMPMPYAFALGLWLNVSGRTLPMPIVQASEVLAQGAIAVMLIILGLQLSHAQLAGRLRPIFVATVVRFGLGAAVALGVAVLFGLQGVTRQVFILEASMPAGVLSGVLSTEFGGDPEFAAATILVTTLLSALVLSGLFLLLG
ncbi:MAG: AEC family transporter [Anaerolineales bacterium]|nr:AEC family transporter [Anaerolineales bacterium]